MIDMQQMKQAVINIMKNAIEATENNGIIAIKTYAFPETNKAAIVSRQRSCITFSIHAIPQSLVARGQGFQSPTGSSRLTRARLKDETKIAAERHLR
jgi:nitrogen-specific signal transduction histidine kinase